MSNKMSTRTGGVLFKKAKFVIHPKKPKAGASLTFQRRARRAFITYYD